jgi:hypothetical protein
MAPTDVSPPLQGWLRRMTRPLGFWQRFAPWAHDAAGAPRPSASTHAEWRRSETHLCFME